MLCYKQLKLINQKLDKIMSAITDWAATEQVDLTNISNELTAVVSGVTSLNSQITALQAQLSGGTLSATDQAALDAVKAASDTLVTQAGAIIPAPAVPAAAIKQQ
jgi:hypothetical protein